MKILTVAARAHCGVGAVHLKVRGCDTWNISPSVWDLSRRHSLHLLFLWRGAAVLDNAALIFALHLLSACPAAVFSLYLHLLNGVFTLWMVTVTVFFFEEGAAEIFPTLIPKKWAFVSWVQDKHNRGNNKLLSVDGELTE